MKTAFAQFVSLALNPVFVLLLLPLLLVYKTTGNLPETIRWTIYSAMYLVIFSAGLWYGVKKKLITDLDVSKREQRPLLFIWTSIFGLLYLASLFLFQAPLILYLITFGVLLGVILASLLNFYLKTSIHVATITAFMVTISIVYGGWYHLSLLLIPLVAWARVKIKRHTVSETIAGAFLGTLLSLGIYALVKLFFYNF